VCRFRAQRCRCEAGSAQGTAGKRKQRAADATTFMGWIDEQRKYRAVARIAGCKALNYVVLYPYPKLRAVDERNAVGGSHRVRIGQPILAHSVTDFHDPLDVRVHGLPDSGRQIHWAMIVDFLIYLAVRSFDRQNIQRVEAALASPPLVA
jgi:hypothetical protein